MTLVALHNGGGVGIGKAINGGFGLVLDGREETDAIIKLALQWDVIGGVARRAWARNDNSIATCIEHNKMNKGTDHITLPYLTKEDLVENLVSEAFKKIGNILAL
jgi:urocanate hydratase